MPTSGERRATLRARPAHSAASTTSVRAKKMLRPAAALPTKLVDSETVKARRTLPGTVQ